MSTRLAPADRQAVLHIRQLDADELRAELDGKCALGREAVQDLWKTTQPLEFDGANTGHCVATDFQTDLVSVPSVVGWFIPRAGRYARAAVLHDYLWYTGVDRSSADRTFRVQLGTDGVTLLRRWIMWAAVRMNAILSGKGGTGWARELPLALLMLLIALPFVIVPALTILIANAAFSVLEWVVCAVAPGEEQATSQWMT